MSRLLLYTDLSPSRPWFFAAIHENREALIQNNIILPPFSPWAKAEPHGHYSYWAARKETEILPQWLQKALLQVKEALDTGKDVLLFGNSRTLAAHSTLYRLVLPLLDKGRHRCHSLFICGRPACLLEQNWWSFVQPDAPLTTKLAFVRQHAAIATLIRHNQQLWGSENITLLADFSELTHAVPQPLLATELFHWLRCPMRTLPQHTIETDLLYASWPARRLFATRKIRDNVFPEMDEGAYLHTLQDIEKGWPRCISTPLRYRTILNHEGQRDLRELEGLCHVPKGSLACPPWLATAEENEPAPLSPEYAVAFVQALPSSVRAPQAQRLTNDADLLSPDQKILASALNDASGEFSHVGEPVPPPTLTVLTMTYNQEKYIAQCMDSVLAQQTAFPVQHIVLDHKSNDATPQIIAQYADRHTSIKPVLLSHHVRRENVRGLFMRCRSKYTSLCDGDDYFTDPLKLQKQVDYLEKNQDCGLCAHPVHVIYEDNDAAEHIYPPDELLPKGPNAKYDLSDLLQGNMIQTNSVVYRWRFTEGLPDWFRADLRPGDWYWHLLHAELGKIGFLPDVMSVYRRHKKAMYHTTQISVQAHRREHGMNELKTYQVVNQHFQGRFFNDLARMANGVLVNFLEISAKEDDSSLLDQAVEKFPEFAKYFLDSLNNIQTNGQ